ncbi:DNA replication/repair protein RecF [uncultured Eubacterium sp.]|uniref:DNA replication/repair protein RecF n=1 Tax=uncultured Eubacterium sp. TaxID=165185 RepID=UPI002673DD72|nr:DNA replication/repair protein RecF [uncultured Eubacterium sp.]
MIITKLELSNFRNYKLLKLDFDNKTNILYGNNAQGKTNILESIYMCSTTKSHRSNKDFELINFDSNEGHIKLYINKNNREQRIDIHLRKNKSKGIAINGIPIKKASELFGIFNVIIFSPEDLNIIKNGPSERRKFIDMELCQLDKIYVYNLVNYNKVLSQRNQLLKDLYFKPELKQTLDVWDMQLAEYGSKVIKRREQFIKEISNILIPIHDELTNGQEEIEVVYEKNSEPDDLYQNILFNREKDIKYKTTSVGPHRDDIVFFNKGKNIKTYGSQGQKRTIALSLKLAEIELVKSLINDKPVLLLDDVLSELDSDRQNHLLKSLDNIQTIITCTGLDEFIENRFKINKVFQVTNGNVAEKLV